MAMSLQEVADELSKQEGRWCCGGVTSIDVWKIEQSAMKKLRAALRRDPELAESLWGVMERNRGTSFVAPVLEGA
jgi:hypothetical protein